jgi:hypothetical protein
MHFWVGTKKKKSLLFLCGFLLILQEKFRLRSLTKVDQNERIIVFFASRNHVDYEDDKNKVPMNKPYNIQNTNICNGIFHISFFKALLINEGELE